jgi:hypothetical protein
MFKSRVFIAWGSFRCRLRVCNSVPMEVKDIETDELPALATRLHFPAAILLEKRMVKRQFWQSHAWYLDTVAIGDGVSSGTTPGDLAYRKPTGDVFRWTGFQVTFYKDACERYWHALISDEPKIYVVCRDPHEADHDHDVEPASVTVDYDEALAFSETDDLVLSTAIPPELYRYMEAFVLSHYRPVPFKKRKRKTWSKGGEQS